MKSPSLSVLKHYGTPRDQWAWQWVCMNFVDGIPSEIDGETLYEVVPAEIRDEVALFFEKPPSKEQ